MATKTKIASPIANTLDPDAKESSVSPRPVPASSNAKNDPINLSYRADEYRVRVTFRGSDCLRHVTPPADLLTRAAARLQRDVDTGVIEFIVAYEERLAKAWDRIRARCRLDATARNQSFSLTVAAGAPALPGLTVTATPDTGTLARITLHAPAAVIQRWRLEWILLHIERALPYFCSPRDIDRSQVHDAHTRASQGETVVDHPLTSLDEQARAPGTTERTYKILCDRSKGGEGIFVIDLDDVDDTAQLDERLRHMAAKNLAALERASVPKDDDALPVPTEATAFRFEVSPDRMQATIAAVDLDLLQVRGLVNETRLQHDARLHGIVYGLKPNMLLDLAELVAAGKNLIGTVIAQGTPPVAGSGPFLADIASGLVTAEAADANVRRYRHQLAVKAGDVVAEVQYREVPNPGRDVSGRTVAPPASEELAVPLGDGIGRRTDGKFVAMRDGRFVNDPDSGMRLDQGLLHQGDVNLTTGDIDFDGNVEISGDIDSGTRVHVGGDLVVKGEIRGGIVICNGHITVARGIVLGPLGIVRAKGNVVCDFVENATIHCGGTLLVKRSILASKIMASTGIEVTDPSGVISGGSVVAGTSIKTAKLGLGNGTKTEVTIGVDVRLEKQLQKHKNRLSTLETAAAAERNILRELSRKKPEQLSKTNKDKKTQLIERAPRWRRILQRAEDLVNLAVKERIEPAGEAVIQVTGTLSTNCIVHVGRQVVPLTQERTSVIISTERAADGTHIKPHTFT